MDYNFVLEKDEYGNLSIEANTVRAILHAEMDWNKDFRCTIGRETMGSIRHFFKLLEVEGQYPVSLVPVGSVQFCNAFSRMMGGMPLPSMNVPEDFNDCPELTGRRFWRDEDGTVLKRLISDERDAMFLVKPDDKAKRFDMRIVRNNLHEIETLLAFRKPPYFISDRIKEDIVAEWRVFFWHNDIVDAKPYYLKDFVAPDKAAVQAMMNTWQNGKPTAGTLDVAVLDGGKTVLIEVHPLIACGLYGFEDRSLLPMLTAAWKWHMKTSKPQIRVQ